MKLHRGVTVYLGVEKRKAFTLYWVLPSHLHIPGVHVLTLSGSGVCMWGGQGFYQDGPCIYVKKGVNPLHIGLK